MGAVACKCWCCTQSRRVTVSGGPQLVPGGLEERHGGPGAEPSAPAFAPAGPTGADLPDRQRQQRPRGAGRRGGHRRGRRPAGGRAAGRCPGPPRPPDPRQRHPAGEVRDGPTGDVGASGDRAVGSGRLNAHRGHALPLVQPLLRLHSCPFLFFGERNVLVSCTLPGHEQYNTVHTSASSVTYNCCSLDRGVGRMQVSPPPPPTQTGKPRMDSECASGCPWSTARATARLQDSRPPE